jgi:antirestriction protein ArdC
MNKVDIYQDVTNRILEAMEAGDTNWLKPFTASSGMPANAVTRNEYHGINVLLLGLLNPFQSSEWASYKQWQEKGANVQKGQKGTRIVFFKQLEKENKDTGKIDRIPLLRYSTVFNADQVDGYKSNAINLPDLTQRLAHCDAYIDSLNIVFGTGSPCYIPSQDSICMPSRCSFTGNQDGTPTEHYYSTMFHEVTHWTGHTSRLDRLSDRSREGYAFEELIAELGAAYQCRIFGIDLEPRADHAKYLGGWLKALKNDKRFIFKAAAAAQKAIGFCDSLQMSKAA